MSGTDDVDNYQRRYTTPHNARNKIPTVQEYRQKKAEERADQQSPTDQSSWSSQFSSYWYGDGEGSKDVAQASHASEDVKDQHPQDQTKDTTTSQEKSDTTQVDQPSDPKEKRKQVKHSKRDTKEREVTDPVTHLPVPIYDFTDKDIEKVDEEEPLQLHAQGKTSTGTSSLDQTKDDLQGAHRAMKSVFPPPDFDAIRQETAGIHRIGIMSSGVAVATIFALDICMYLVSKRYFNKALALTLFGAAPLLGSTALVWTIHQWVENRVKDIWEDEIWFAQNQAVKHSHRSHRPESTQWLNMLLKSIWPLVNPSLFTGVSDTLEDVMQASLPSLVRMVSVEDIGQGSEPLRILGVKWLSKGAAGRTVNPDGSLVTKEENREKQKDTDPASGESAADDDEKEQNQFQAEEGDFINLELSFAYRANKSRQKFRDRARNAHLLLAFYLPGNLKLPVWVELRGFVGSMRMRMQVTPDPPFVALTTITLLGQPKVNLSCVPLVKRGVNLLDLPIISNFVQSALDAAMSEYVAPKSITIDLKSMLAGDDFKKDTASKGLLIVKIKRAFDFKEGDTSIPFIMEGKSDAYVSVGWAKFGKPVWSTRVIVNDQEPYWQEECQVLVGAEELDADESLRVQLWDSDRFTADDDLGRIELNLKDLMKHEKSNGKMWDRVDPFEALSAGEGMPGRLEWSVGYFSKVRLQDWQVKQQQKIEDVNTLEELKTKVYYDAERKLREATRNESAEIEQQKRQDLEAAEIEMLTDTMPDDRYPSGILSIHIHQIVGLELESLQKPRDDDAGETEGAEEESDSLPSAYCTIILNHQKVYKTRTKPKNSKPYFNASTERFVRDWRSTSLIISVRDARVNEEDALLGVIALPLGEMFLDKKTSRFNDFFPLVGGIGYGRARISIVFRSVGFTPEPKDLGWDYGTLVIQPDIRGTDNLPDHLTKCRLRLDTKIEKRKMHPAGSTVTKAAEGDISQGMWTHGYTKRRALRLGVRKRYSARLMVEFRPSSTGLLAHTHSEAYAVLWLSEIVDCEKQTLTIPVYSLSKDRKLLERASQNVLPEDQSGERVGSIKVTLRFDRGLGARHYKLAKRNLDMRNVMEVLSVVQDNDLGTGVLDGGNIASSGKRHHHRAVDGKKSLASNDHAAEETESLDGADIEGDSGSEDDDDSGDDSDASSHGSGTGVFRRRKKTDSESTKVEDDEAHANDGTIGGMLSTVRSYHRHQDQLHRRHRGIMQFKPARTAKWMKGKAEMLIDKVEEKFEHRERQPGIETEV